MFYGLGKIVSVMPPLTVLINSDKYVRDHWNAHFCAANRPLITFASAENFLAEFELDPSVMNGAEFYLDQDFGFKLGIGIKLARAIRDKLPYAKIFLLTTYPVNCFSHELESGLLNAIYAKVPWATA
jgi:hypothetical protein